MKDTPVTLAAVIGAHGVAGEVRLKLLGDGFAALAAHERFNDGALTLRKLRDDGKGGAIARFAEVADRTAAEKLRGTVLTVVREALRPWKRASSIIPTCSAFRSSPTRAKRLATSAPSRISARRISSRSRSRTARNSWSR